MVYVDGSVTTCCLDEHLENRIGNLRESSLSSLWNGQKMHAWRLAQIRGDFKGSGPLCPRCNWRSAGSYPPDEVETYLKKTGEEEALQAAKLKVSEKKG
jgi:radical SAM protein with 4Fe4S-binding SPASM domain